MLRPTLLLAACVGLALPSGELEAQRRGSFLSPSEDVSTTRVAQRGANFLEIGVGARAQALGGALTGLVRGAAATYWNPAGLGLVDGFTAAFTHSELYGDLGVNHDFAAAALPFAGGGLAVSYIRFASGDIERTDEANPGGDDPTFGSTFEWAGTAIGLHYGRQLTDRLRVGATGRIIREGIDRATASWWGVDVGTQFRTGLYGLTLGAALANVGPSARMEGPLITQRVATQEAFPVALPVRFNTTAYQLPITFRFAVVSELVGGADAMVSQSGLHQLQLAADVNDAVDTDIQFGLGVEYGFRELVYLRVGKKFVNEAFDESFRSFTDFLSFGGGIVLPIAGRRLLLDYAYGRVGELENVQIFSFELGG